MTRNRKIALIGNILILLSALFIGYVAYRVEYKGACYAN